MPVRKPIWRSPTNAVPAKAQKVAVVVTAPEMTERPVCPFMIMSASATDRPLLRSST